MTASSGRRQRYFSAAAIKLHLTLLIAGSGCLAAGWFEWTRALGGHQLAWVYAFEWPFFAVAGGVLWWRLLPSAAPGPRVELLLGDGPLAPESRPPDRAAPADAGLIAWQDYLARLQASDPPGAPPWT